MREFSKTINGGENQDCGRETTVCDASGVEWANYMFPNNAKVFLCC